jgi:hypothetical protein
MRFCNGITLADDVFMPLYVFYTTVGLIRVHSDLNVCYEFLD